MDAKGQTAIVTGGGSGLGAETARHLAKAGAKVSIFDMNMEGANAVAKEIGGSAFECNVADEASVRKAFEASQAANGVARILVNCAGIGPAALIVNREGETHDFAQYRKVIEVNLIGTFHCLAIGAQAMIPLEPANEDGERGVIINTASVAAFEGQIGQAAYSSSKGGVYGLTLPAAREFGRHGIRVLTIAPGYIGTPLLQTMPEKVQENLKSTQVFPNQRFGKPEEYARLAMHMVENTMLNGEIIRLDAGARMPPR
jgi:NAD(P)-dependent dehydrogenase (short-subunit alcohol dehydrogenase family)